MLEVCCFFGVASCSCVVFADLYSTDIDIGFSDVKIPLFEDCKIVLFVLQDTVCVHFIISLICIHC